MLLLPMPTTKQSSKGRLEVTAPAVAWLDLLAPPANLANMADLASPVLPVSPDSPAAHQRSASPQHCPHANPAHKAQPDLLVPKDQSATLAPTDLQALLAKMPRMVLLAHQDHQDLPDLLDPMVPLVRRVKTDQAHLLCLVNPASLVIMALRDLPALPALLDRTELLVLLAKKDPTDPPDPMERTASPAKMAPTDHQVQLERRVSAPNTAAWTEEFSSKMEPGVKPPLDQPQHYHSFLISLLFLLVSNNFARNYKRTSLWI